MGKHSIEKRDNTSSTSLFDIRVGLAAGQATSMSSRRRTRKIGATAGGLLGLAFLPLAVAHADDWTVTPDPGYTETITGIYGHGFSGGDTAPPAVAGSLQGDQVFDYTSPTGGSGTFYGFESYSNDGLGGLNAEVYVAPVPLDPDSPYADVSYTGEPPVGSVFDTYSLDAGLGLSTNVYSAIPNGDGTATITDTLTTSTGTMVIPTTFDAADGLIADAGGVGVGNGGTMEPVGSQLVTSISGIPPLTAALQGTQDFNFFNSAGDVVGKVATVDTNTTDAAGTYTEAVLITSDNGLTNVGTSAADVPAEGSIFNTINFYGLVNVYSDFVSPGGDHYLDTLYTPLGNYVIPISMDAAMAETLSDSPVTFANGMTFDPTSELNFTGINGLPPVDVGVQGVQDFSFTDGATTGTFTADVTNTLDQFVDSTETILVTSSSDPAVLPAGSEFEVVNFGSGFESIYSDIASSTSGGNTILETLVTPFGDIPLPPAFDAAAGLFNDMFSIIAGGNAL
ncbi:MAG TPA: hypothetical protein VGG53_09620 [Mycobacterium sp.]|jgi:hypothetical protein|uniref:hypothetical protein n=1 Tax=Mycobacterium sp. TaxID=1785 RepID=UPI002F3F6904